MTLPASPSASNYDQASDDPAQARPQLKTLRDAVDTIIAHLGGSTITDTNGPADPAGGLEVSGTDLRVTMAYRAITGADTIVAGDRGKMLDCTSAGLTLAVTAAATLGDGFYCAVRNSAGSGNVTVNSVDGGTILGPGESMLVTCNGSAFKSVGLRRRAVGFAARGGGTAIAAGNYLKVDFATEDFDSHAFFTNSRFTPLLSGVYLVIARIALVVNASKSVAVGIYKNGAVFKQGQIVSTGTGISTIEIEVTALVALNGTTDYVECFAFNGDSISQNISTDSEKSHFSAMRLADWTS